MMLLIRNAETYSPAPLGRRDILIAGGRVVAVASRIEPDFLPGEVKEIDAEGMFALPGFVDSHVHLIGGGGEGGYATRTPELQLGACVQAGVTTVVGTLGTDGLARSMESLVAKAYALREEGISCWIYTGSYRVPPRTVTGDVMKDIMMVDPVIGLGELALSDHRSSRPTLAELGRLASEARLGGMLSGKSGMVNVHLGDAPAGFGPLEELVAAGDLPRSQFLPTHCGRNPELFAAAVRWALAGGWVDLTTSTVPRLISEGEISAAKAMRALHEAGVSFDLVSCSSDGQGSLPVFDARGALSGMKVGTSASLWEAVREAILREGIPLEEAVKTITSTPATALKLPRKGIVAEGADGDLVLLRTESLAIDTVVAGGRVMLRGGELLVRGSFED